MKRLLIQEIEMKVKTRNSPYLHIEAIHKMPIRHFNTVMPLHLSEFIESQKKAVQAEMQRYLNRNFAMQKAIREQERLYRELNKALIPHGWFISPAWPAKCVHEFEEIRKTEGIEGIIKALIETFSEHEYIKEAYENIITNLIVNNRKHIIVDAFDAHLNGKYYLSVPIFLIQAEGIYNDCMGVDRLKANNVKKRFKNCPEIYESMIDPFNEFIQFLYKGYSIKKNPPSLLSRHIIIHGNSVDYGTPENSIKAILFVEYVLSMVNLSDKNAK
ncbi:MAG: hypothetical protein HY786_00345 [Deltaproteobacteria bacterium]|nr:hypothetical protein [Deltaproteobacteria bacterium]